MPPLRRGTPRSPERQHLAEAIAAHESAVTQQGRVAAAERRLSAQLFNEHLPAVETAKEALVAAREAEPRRLVDAALDPDGPSARSFVADAERELAEAERRVEEVRKSREILTEEARRTGDAVETARHQLGNAVEAVVRADPSTAALVAEFKRVADRALSLAMTLRTAGQDRDINVDGHGQRLVITNIPVPLGWPSAFAPDRRSPPPARRCAQTQTRRSPACLHRSHPTTMPVTRTKRRPDPGRAREPCEPI